MDMMRFNDFYLRLHKGDAKHDGLAILEDFYTLWREAENSGVDADSLQEEAKGVLQRIVAKDLFLLAACEWIGEKGHFKLGKALAHEISVRYLQHTELLKFSLSEATEECATTVARRLCALDVPVAVSLGWALSMSEDLPPSQLITSTIAKVTNFLAKEHPATCKRLLESESSPFADSQVAQQLAKRLATELDALEALPQLVELRMSSEMRRSLRYLRRSESRAVTQRAQGESFLADMFMVSEHFKYSNQVAVEHQNDQQTVETMIPMFTHEMSVELPQTWIADPFFYGHMVADLWKEACQ
ncbi:hypothetical protein PSE10A_54840 [Pseudomonas amygdali pv. eriobotryae]|uniref:Uncharacterized protein n=1 Tax=Pseudomonas amygdali pv. eriobotryae TaxID=129137 RepID=A0A9P3AK05_PSEA0|nr:hypothetical protein [Pseudomonas amygdali]GFZ62973.1 hypothetical protein PSE10A_54840 [Pseudomonas amygdali pv. eriobotryae]